MLQLLVTVILLIIVGALAVINNGHLTPASWVATAALVIWVVYLIVRAVVNAKRKPGA